VALAYSLPDDARFIPTRLAIDYLAKARGPLRGTCDCPILATNAQVDLDLDVAIVDASGREVAHAVISTRVGPLRRL
jgi:hypothetical protein